MATNLKLLTAVHHVLLVLEKLDTYTRKGVIEVLVEMEEAGGEKIIPVANTMRARPVTRKIAKIRRRQVAKENGHGRTPKPHPTGDGTFAAALRQERDRMGLSQSELAEKLGLHRSLIGLYEGGYAAPATERTKAPLRKLLPALDEYLK